MDSPYSSPPVQGHDSRPSLGFPLGTALLLITIFSLSGIFSCCYHWEKLRSLRGRGPLHDDGDSTDLEADVDQSSSKPKPSHANMKQNKQQSLPVLMPGDKIPKFIAMPCPCQPPMAGKIIVEVQKPPKPPQIAVPLY